MQEDKFEEQMKAIELIRKEYEELKFIAGLEERRKDQRVPETLPVQFQGHDLEAHLLSVDLGGGGIRIHHDNSVELGKIYSFSIFLESLPHPVAVRGRAVWQQEMAGKKGYEIGFMFEEIGDEEREAIKKLVAARGSTEREDKRRFLRVPKLLFVSVERGDAKEILPGLILDISPGGVRLLTSRQISEGTVVALSIELEERSPIQVQGKVVWGNQVEALRKFQHGIEFVHGIQFEEHAKAIDEMIEEYIKFRYQQAEVNMVELLLGLGKSQPTEKE